MQTKGLPLRLSTLVYGGSPIHIPEPDDYPCIGCWSADNVAAALKAFESLDTSALDPGIAETLAQMHGWLKEAAKSQGTALMGFLS